MTDEKKKALSNEEAEEQEIDLEDLEQVTGGSISNVNYTKTGDISNDTKSKI